MQPKLEEKRDFRLDLEPFSDEAIAHAVAFLLGGASMCRKHKGDPLQAETGKLLLGLAVALGFEPPPDPPAPASSMN